MRVDLDPEVADLIQQRVAGGRYANATDVVRDALHLLEERERLDYMRAALAEANAQFERGEYVEWTPGFLERLEEESEELYLLGIEPHPDVCP